MLDGAAEASGRLRRAAWLGWAQIVERSGDRERAIQITQQALDRSSLKSEADRARIELLSSDLRQDLQAHAKALAHLYRLSPDDTAVLSVLADTEILARDFVNGALHLRTLIQLNPANSNALNENSNMPNENSNAQRPWLRRSNACVACWISVGDKHL